MLSWQLLSSFLHTNSCLLKLSLFIFVDLIYFPVHVMKKISSISLCNFIFEGIMTHIFIFLCEQFFRYFKITFYHFVIQVDWKNTRLLHPSLALDSDRHKVFSGTVISLSMCSFQLLHAALLSDRWHGCELTGSWNMEVNLVQNRWAPVTVDFVDVENSYTCVSENLKSQKKNAVGVANLCKHKLVQTQNYSYTFSNT